MKDLRTVFFISGLFLCYQISSAQDLLNLQEPTSNKEVHINNKFRLGLDYGFAYNIGTVPEDIDSETEQYINDLKKGYFIGGSIMMSIDESTSIGVKISSSRSSAVMDAQFYDDGDLITGKVRDNVQNTLYAATYSARFFDDFGTATIGSSLGYMHHLDYGSFFGVAAEEKGGAFAIGLELAYDIYITDNISFGLQGAYISSNMSSYTLTIGDQTETVNLDQDNRISLGRWELGGGLRISF